MSSCGEASAPDPGQRVRNVRSRDRLGRPLPYGSVGVAPLRPGGPRTPSETLEAAQRLLDAGLLFQAHEVLEEAWKSAPQAERDLWRGLAQLAVAVTHAARGNRRGAEALLRRGASRIADYRNPYGLDIAGLRDWADRAADDVRDRGTTPPGLQVRPRR